VVQGFGKKTDLTTGRTLDLDASYQVIKEAVEDAGLRCIRADEVVKSGTIDIPMYRWILEAELVIADLSTYNVNAAYELGVRYGVAPRATITIAEDQFKNPFDVSHIVVHNYRHLGEDIGAAEARRFKKALADTIRDVLAAQKADSPIYEFFELEPPVKRAVRAAAATPAVPAASLNVGPVAPLAGAPVPVDEGGAKGQLDAKGLLDRAKKAMAEGRFLLAQELLSEIHEIRPGDESVVQQLVLATYKGQQPDPLSALRQAREIMIQHLNPQTTNDPETLGLWGAVHKGLWNATGERAQLDAAIAGYERGFYLKQDYYNGINLAFLLNMRAAQYGPDDTAEAIADTILARRVRREVMRLCETALTSAQGRDDEYWIVATLWESAVGLEDPGLVAKWQAAAEQRASVKWMLESTTGQIAALQKLLDASPLKRMSLR
jgi:hypothetical protein